MVVTALSRPAEVSQLWEYADTPRVLDLRHRVRSAMEEPPLSWTCPSRIDDRYMSEPLPVRKARAIALKLSLMPVELWEGQLFAGSMTLEHPHVHYERGFPDYATEQEHARALALRLTIRSVFGHIVPDYPRLLHKGLPGIMADAKTQRARAESDEERAFLDSVEIALQAVIDYAERLATHCDGEAATCEDMERAEELHQMAANLREVSAGPVQTFWQALQSVWLLHMIFHSTMNGNAVGRLDQYAWPYLEADLEAGRLDMAKAAELIACFCLKFNERAKTTDDQLPESRAEDEPDLFLGTGKDLGSRHASTSSQAGTMRDRVDATNHWLQNIVVGGLTPSGEDGTNPLTYLLLEAYRRNQMTNPLLTLRLHRDSPDELVRYACEVLKDGGGMPALFNDEQLIPAIECMGIPLEDARDYTSDGCWETIIPGRTDFGFQRLSTMLCLEYALNRGRSRQSGQLRGLDLADARDFASYDQVWQAFLAQLDHMIGRHVRHVADTVNNRSLIAPVPLLSALIDGAIESRRDMTAGGAKYRTHALLAESAAHTIDSLVAIKRVIFEDKTATMAELCDALDAHFQGDESLRAKLLAAPKYGNDDPYADQVGREVIDAFTSIALKHTQEHTDIVKWGCGVATFSWYIGIGEGLGASPDGRLAGEPVSSNFSPALGRDKNGIPGAILSYAAMHNFNLPIGGPLDLRLNRDLVRGEKGTDRMAALVRSFVETGGGMMTLTVVDAEELRAAQREPEKYKSLRVRMGGWCAYFTMLSRQQQKHQIRRQEGQV